MNAVKSDLLRALQITSKAVHPKPIIPLFSNILLEVSGDTAQMSATNFEISIRVTFPVKKSGKFSTCIPAKLMTDLISMTASNEIGLEFKSQSNELVVKTKNSTNTVKCIPSDDFPQTQTINKPTLKTDAVALKKSISRTTFCAKSGDDQSALAGVQIKLEGNKLILFAVDGFHLSYDETEIPKKNRYTKEAEAIIKASTLDTVAKILDESGDVAIEITDRNIVFNSENIIIVVQRLDGNFPPYERLLSVVDGTNTSITVPTLEMLQACKVVELFTDANKADLTTSGGMITQLSSVSTEKGKGKMEIGSVITGSPITIQLNVLYLRQFLEICDADDAVIDLISDKKPVLLTMKDNPHFKHIIMPIAT